jgi:tetratricopeptide (TPR) repeat protein
LLQNSGRPREAEAAFGRARDLHQQLAKDFPAVPGYRQNLASTHTNLGVLLQTTGRPQEAEAAYRQARDLQQQLAQDFPSVPDYANGLANTLVSLAILRIDQKNPAAAQRYLEQAEPYHRAALKANPRNPLYREVWRKNRGVLCLALCDLGDHMAAANAADQLAGIGFQPSTDTYDAACYVARCMPLAEKDMNLPAEQRKVLAQQYADRAMAVLKQAVAKGYKDAGHMKKDSDLDPLRSREDFQKLLAELEKGSLRKTP